MNTDDLLRDAISAARDHADEGVSDGAATRLRIRESLDKRGQARRKHLTVIAAVIASLLGSTAFAYWAGWRPPWSRPDAATTTHDEASIDRVSMRLPDTDRPKRGHGDTTEQADVTPPLPTPPLPTPPLPAPPPPAPPPSRVSQPARTSTPRSPAETARTTAVTTSAPAVPLASASRDSAAEPSAPHAAPTAIPAAPTAPRASVTAIPADEVHPDPELAAYGRAHNLHFRGGDPQAALAAWDAYLAAYPDGKLAMEARYDRALVLVKLARWADARAALAPFATATAGSYRQREAAALLAAIRDR